MAGIMTGVGSSKARNIYCSTISSQNKVVRSYAQQLRSSVISNERRRDILNKMRSEMTALQFRRPEKRSAGAVPVSREYTSKIQTGTAASGNYSKIQTAVNHSERNYEAAELPGFSDVRENMGHAPVPIKTNVGKRDEHSSSEEKIKPYDEFLSEGSCELPEYIASVVNSYHYELSYQGSNEKYTPPSLIQTGGQSATHRIRKAVDNRFIHSQRNTDFIQTANISYSDEVKAIISEAKKMDAEKRQNEEYSRRQIAVRIVGLKRNRAKNRRYGIAAASAAETDRERFVPKHTRTQAYIRAVGIKERQLQNRKYIVASADTEDSAAIEIAELIHSAADTVVRTGGIIRTAVKGTAM